MGEFVIERVILGCPLDVGSVSEICSMCEVCISLDEVQRVNFIFVVVVVAVEDEPLSRITLEELNVDEELALWFLAAEQVVVQGNLRKMRLSKGPV